MKSQNWILLFIVFTGAYLIGVKFPATGQTLLSKVGA
jgi:hypothetical protein